ncbi:hypothetical protein JI435_301020, partial [Parastagonospora nodorum SN15]
SNLPANHIVTEATTLTDDKHIMRPRISDTRSGDAPQSDVRRRRCSADTC